MNRRRCILSSCKDCSLQEVRCRAHCLCHRFLRQRCPIFTRSNFSCFSKFLSISLHNNTSVYKLVHDEQYLSKAVKQGCLLHIFSESNWNGIVKWVEDLHWYKKRKKKKSRLRSKKVKLNTSSKWHESLKQSIVSKTRPHWTCSSFGLIKGRNYTLLYIIIFII